MEAKNPSPNTEKTGRASLTPLRIIRGVLCLFILISTAFMMLVYMGFASSVITRFLSRHQSRRATSFFFGSWIALWPFLFEKINGTRVVFSGEKGLSNIIDKRVLLIANHGTEVDWMYLWDLALRKGMVGYIKYVLKSSLMKLPLFGWSFQVMEFVPVARKWEIDEPVMRAMVSSFRDPRDPLWLSLFPEGTDFTEQKCIRSKKYAEQNGLPVLNHVLLPKTKGFFLCLDTLRATLDSVYDITIAYKHCLPTFMDNVYGVAPSEVHIHLRRVSVDSIPVSEQEVNAWLVNAFRVKDQMLSDFRSRGRFPDQGNEDILSTGKCIVNFVAVILMTSIFTYFTFFSSVWFKIYVPLVCAYLSLAACYNIRPVPIVDLVRSWKKQKSS